jgi:hypothetical protein
VIEGGNTPMSKTNPQPDTTPNLNCSFCGKSEKEVKKLISQCHTCICDECVGLCSDIIADALPKTKPPTTKDEKLPADNAAVCVVKHGTRYLRVPHDGPGGFWTADRRMAKRVDSHILALTLAGYIKGAKVVRLFTKTKP